MSFKEDLRKIRIGKLKEALQKADGCRCEKCLNLILDKLEE